VLCHSLPGREADLTIAEYELCEAMCGSDHRPVAALINLYVEEDAGVGPPECLNSRASLGLGLGDNKGLKVYKVGEGAMGQVICYQPRPLAIQQGVGWSCGRSE
jgi:hypothetical protein